MTVGGIVRALTRIVAVAIFAGSVLFGIGSAVYGYFWAIHPSVLVLTTLMFSTIGALAAFVVMLIGYAAFPPPK